MIVDTPVSASDLWPSGAQWPRRRAEGLLQRFRTTFPAIVYDLAWQSHSVNAQAFTFGGTRRVRLYGGLGRHRTIGLAGLAFVLAHETGHHLAGPPSDPIYPWLSSDARADQWAVEDGLATVFGRRRAAKLAARGLRQLIALQPPGDAKGGRQRDLLIALANGMIPGGEAELKNSSR